MALVEVNEMRRLENRKDKWYGFRTFVCPTSEVIQHVTALRNQPFPEATPGICVCNDTRTQYDADKTDGRAKIHAFYGPVDIGGGVRPRRKQYAEIHVRPSGKVKKLMFDQNGQRIEGFDQDVKGRINRWEPNFDNIIPDGIQRVTVKTAVDKPFSSGTNILTKGGKVNREGGQWDWFGFGAEELYFLGMYARTDFDDDSLVAIDYDFLYDPEGWNTDKQAISSAMAQKNDRILRITSEDPVDWEFITDRATTTAWVPNIYVYNDYTISVNAAEIDLIPWETVSFDFLQGMTWW